MLSFRDACVLSSPSASLCCLRIVVACAPVLTSCQRSTNAAAREKCGGHRRARRTSLYNNCLRTCPPQELNRKTRSTNVNPKVGKESFTRTTVEIKVPFKAHSAPASLSIKAIEEMRMAKGHCLLLSMKHQPTMMRFTMRLCCL